MGPWAPGLGDPLVAEPVFGFYPPGPLCGMKGTTDGPPLPQGHSSAASLPPCPCWCLPVPLSPTPCSPELSLTHALGLQGAAVPSWLWPSLCSGPPGQHPCYGHWLTGALAWLASSFPCHRVPVCRPHQPCCCPHVYRSPWVHWPLPVYQTCRCQKELSEMQVCLGHFTLYDATTCAHSRG